MATTVGTGLPPQHPQMPTIQQQQQQQLLLQQQRAMLQHHQQQQQQQQQLPQPGKLSRNYIDGITNEF